MGPSYLNCKGKGWGDSLELSSQQARLSQWFDLDQLRFSVARCLLGGRFFGASCPCLF